MTSRTAFQQATLLRSIVSRQSIRQQSKKNINVRSLHSATAANSASSSRASFVNGYSTLAAAGIAVSSLAFYLHQNGIQVQLLAYAKADEPVTPHAALDESPIHREPVHYVTLNSYGSMLTFYCRLLRTVDPDTSIPFPATVTPIGSSSGALKLIGIGVRTV